MKPQKTEGNILQRSIHFLLSPCDPSNLGIFRFMFGLLMMVDIPQERGFAHIQSKWQDDMCYFTMFNFLQPMSFEWMHVLYTVLFLAAVGIMLGFLYRLSCMVMVVCYWYIFFLDKGVWNNHSYLYGLISIMLLMTDCNRYWSIDGLLFPSIRNSHIPKWNYVLFKFQVFLVYFYAGIKKLDRDWMTGYSMSGLASKWVFDPFRPFLSNENIDFYLVHISGLCYDMFVGFFLLFEKTRLIGIIFSLMFHGMNSQMFHIGMFSYTMMGSLGLFCSERWPKILLSKLPNCLRLVTPLVTEANPSDHCVYSCDGSKKKEGSDSKKSKTAVTAGEVKWRHMFMLAVFSSYVGIQCFLPYSHFLTKGYNAWTEGLYGYSWDMMVHSWSTQHIRIKVVDKADGKELYIRPGAFIGGGGRAHSRWSSHPDMIKQYVMCLSEKLKAHKDIKLTEPEVYVDIWRSLNQRFQQRFVDPNVNLVEAPWSPFAHSPWLLPLLTELSPWRQKMNEIEQKTLNTSIGKFTDIVFIADFPGLMLENFVSEDLNTSMTILNGRVNVEIDNANYTLNEGEEMTLPSNTTHIVYTISDTPACWMYVYLNMTIMKNETLRKWVLHPETRPSTIQKQEYNQKPVIERFTEFLSQKYAVFYVSFWNSYYAIGHLTVGLEYPWNKDENTTSTYHKHSKQEGSGSTMDDTSDLPTEGVSDSNQKHDDNVDGRTDDKDKAEQPTSDKSEL